MITRDFLFSPGLPGERKEISHSNQKKSILRGQRIFVFLCIFPVFWLGYYFQYMEEQVTAQGGTRHFANYFASFFTHYTPNSNSLKWQI